VVEFYYNCSTNKEAILSPFEVMLGFQLSTPVDRLSPLAGATADAAEWMINIKEITDLVKHLLILSKERISAKSTPSTPKFHVGDLVYIYSRGLHIRLQKCKQSRDRKLGPFKVMGKVDRKS